MEHDSILWDRAVNSVVSKFEEHFSVHTRILTARRTTRTDPRTDFRELPTKIQVRERMDFLEIKKVIWPSHRPLIFRIILRAYGKAFLQIRVITCTRLVSSRARSFFNLLLRIFQSSQVRGLFFRSLI